MICVDKRENMPFETMFEKKHPKTDLKMFNFIDPVICGEPRSRGWCIFLLNEERFRTPESSKSQGSYEPSQRNVKLHDIIIRHGHLLSQWFECSEILRRFVERYAFPFNLFTQVSGVCCSSWFHSNIQIMVFLNLFSSLSLFVRRYCCIRRSLSRSSK